jgi:lipid A 3-O-deacylase
LGRFGESGLRGMKTGLSFALALAGAFAGSSLLAGCSSLSEQAAANYPSSASPVSEVRLGALAHDPLSPERGSADVSGEVLFAKPFTSSDPLYNALLPRPDIGFSANTGGKTSAAYAGVAWDYNITNRIFGEAGFGGSVNNGHGGLNPPVGHSAIGCNELFRESGTLGYRLTQNWSVMATVEHMSNAGLCDRNRGITNEGVKVGYSF